MKSRNPVVATAMKNGAWWDISIPGHDKKLRTPSVGKIEELIRQQAIASQVDRRGKPVISVEYQLSPALAPVAQKWRADEHLPITDPGAERRRKAALSYLHAAGYSMREIEKVLGISLKRVLQILKT